MKVLMVNKFLYPNGGSETYVFKLGAYLQSQGHEVQYFGMQHEKNCVGNAVGAYTSNMDFHGGNPLKKLLYSLKTIYSVEARKKIRAVLDNFQPDVVHLNNFNYQLTPSIIFEVKKAKIPLVQTVHDCQIACPNHRMYIEKTGKICSECVHQGNYIHCVKNKCLDNSLPKSLIAMMESVVYHFANTYNLVDQYICPSQYICDVIIQGGVQKNKTSVLTNPADAVAVEGINCQKEKYVLYFGRVCKEKGIETLLRAASMLRDVQFVVAGSGPLEHLLQNQSNVQFVGFKSGKQLNELIQNAICTICPSEWYENCPLSIVESQVLGIPVIGTNLGGIPELIEHGKTGFLFEAGDANALAELIQVAINQPNVVETLQKNCLNKVPMTMQNYAVKLLEIYQKAGEFYNGNTTV